MKVLRVNDAVMRRAGDGSWDLAQYYQQREISQAFRALRCDAEITAFGRLFRGPFSVEYRIEGKKWKCDGIPVAGRGVGPFLWGALRKTRQLRTLLLESDVAWVVLPTLTGLWSLLVKPKSARVMVQFVGDPYLSLKMQQKSPSKGVIFVLFDWLTRLALKRAAAVAYVSGSLRQRYGPKQGIPVCVAHESRVAPSMLLDRAELRRRTAGQPLRLGYVGRFEAEKNILALLDAVAALDSVELELVGKGSMTQTIVQRIEQLGIRTRVQMTGQIVWGPELLSKYRTFDVLVLPSKTEGLPLVIIEAMSQGVPTIASRVGGIPELIDHGMDGLLVPPDDVGALANAINRLKENEVLRYTFATRCLEKARQQTSDVVYQRICACVISVTHEAQR